MAIVVTEYPALAGRHQVLAAVAALQEDLAAGTEWENDTLLTFLEAFAALLASVENAYVNAGERVPDDPWQIMAKALLGAPRYE